MAQVYHDFNGLAALRAQARDDQDSALDEVTAQFESLFLQMMLKSMRQASFGGGIMDSKQSEFYRDMYDQQLAVDLSGQQGIGLAAMLKRQLGGAQVGARSDLRVEDYRAQPLQAVLPNQKRAQGVAVDKAEGPSAIESSDRPIRFDGTPEGFVRELWPIAQQAAAQLDLAPEALLAQAALETGWGRHIMRHDDGSSSHNLFGIKTGRAWQGERVQVDTLEFKEGVALRTRADFRAYQSFADSFQDYIGFVRDNPRYAQAVQAAGDSEAYFQQLQKAGYATDPEYAQKISRILNGDVMQSVCSNLTGEGAG